MPFVPLFQEVGESEIIEKLFVVVHRDMKPALDLWYLTENLPEFAVMARANLDEFTYPLLIAGPQRTLSRETESGEWLDQDLLLGVGLAVKDVSAPAVKIRSEKYVRALTAVIRKGVPEFLPDPSAEVGYTIEISHEYFHHRTKGTDYIQEVEFQIKINFGEK